MAKTISGEIFKNMMIEAAASIGKAADEINALNVFPVPDGDTGTNMHLTLNAAAAELSKHESPTLGKALEVCSSALLRGARGNSGVITSLIFRGFAKALKDRSEIDGTGFANGLTEGAATAYNAVMKPAEGTMLTIARVCADEARSCAQKGGDASAVMQAAVDASKLALPLTVEQNPVLKKAGVVDAGAYGFILILESMYAVLLGKATLLSLFKAPKPASAAKLDLRGADFSAFDSEDITFEYCTEFLINKKSPKDCAPKLRSALNALGDSLVVVEDQSLVKIHLHTDRPDKAMAEGLKYGGLSGIKIENMSEQLERKSEEGRPAPTGGRTAAKPEKRYGFVAVGAGEGVHSVFVDLGVDTVVDGGQTMNPSTEDILHAVEQTPSEVVFILPNNKNIIMSSEQAATLSSKQVVVLPTKTIPQGIASMLEFNPDLNIDQNREAMLKGLALVSTGYVTYAAADRDFDGKKIKKGDYLAFTDSRLICNAESFDEVLKRLAKNMCSNKSSFITIFYGKDVEQTQAEAVRTLFEREAKNAEVNLIFGGQPVYSYIISVE